jgi:hypothetical protein
VTSSARALPGERAAAAGEPPITSLAYAVADALAHCGFSRAGAESVVAVVESDGTLPAAPERGRSGHFFALRAGARRLEAFTAAWNAHVSAGRPVCAATPEGEGILVTHRGSSPLDATTALRVAWS